MGIESLIQFMFLPHSFILKSRSLGISTAIWERGASLIISKAMHRYWRIMWPSVAERHNWLILDADKIRFRRFEV